jgi:hypothetical protein
MKKTGVILIFIILFVSCNQKIENRDIQKINGYWEIEKVVFPQGEDKVYNVNEDYDYFKIDKQNKGFRKKVKPQLDGTFLVNNTFEKVTITSQNNKVILHYKTAFATWKEALTVISDDKMVLTTQANINYYYKKAAPINILKKDEKNK